MVISHPYIDIIDITNTLQMLYTCIAPWMFVHVRRVVRSNNQLYCELLLAKHVVATATYWLATPSYIQNYFGSSADRLWLWCHHHSAMRWLLSSGNITTGNVPSFQKRVRHSDHCRFRNHNRLVAGHHPLVLYKHPSLSLFAIP